MIRKEVDGSVFGRNEGAVAGKIQHFKIAYKIVDKFLTGMIKRFGDGIESY
jgi:hypothetical protein